jgi:hypothetical protein
VTPIGSEYMLGVVGLSDPVAVNTRAVKRLVVEAYASDGATLLARAEAPNAGDAVSLSGVAVAGASVGYFLISDAFGSADDLQRYNVAFTQTYTALYVDKAHNGPEQGTPQNPFRTVSAAINAATSAVRTIYVRAGNYNEQPRITKNVRLLNWGNTGQARIGKP